MSAPTLGFQVVDGALTCRGLSLDELAERFGTPLYVYDVEGIEERIRRFQRAFQGVDLLLAYSVKANGNLALLNRIAAAGAGADIVSGGELHRALRAGVPAERIVFAGVGKTREELRAGIEAGIRAFHVESHGELDALAELAAEAGATAPVGIRVNPAVESPTHAYTKTGHATSKFGIPIPEAEEIYRAAAAFPSLRFVGIDVHIGSQILDTAPYAQAFEIVLALVDRLREAGVSLEYLDLGGGYGVGYDGGDGLDLESFAERVVPEIASRKLGLVLEPGRAIVAESGVLLVRVLYVKRSGGKTFVVTDGGMTDLLRPALYQGWHRIDPVRRREGAGAAVEVVDVVGPVCETGDFLGLDRELPLSEPGDVLAVRDVGAYGFAMTSNYNARPRAAEVMVEGGVAHLVRERETLEGLSRGEGIP